MNSKHYIGQYAGFGSRTAAYLLDVLVLYGIRLFVSWVTISFAQFFGIEVTSCQPIGASMSVSNLVCLGFSVFLIIFNLTIAFFYYAFFWIMAGQTIGKYVLGVRLVRLDGHRMNLWHSLVRYFGYFISMAPLALGFFWIIGDDRRQGWHDKLARTCVVYAWEGSESGRVLSRVDNWVNKRFNLEPPESGLAKEES